MKTRKRLARRVTEMDTVVIGGVARKVHAIESVDYGQTEADRERTTLWVAGLPPQHFWWDDKVDVLVHE